VSHRTVSDIGEHALISRITARLSMPAWVVVGPGDDAAVIQPERGALDVLTTDALVEGVHFDRRFVPPDAIGHRALAVNLSDLAAMGARPRAALLSFVLPDELEVEAVDGIVDGLIALADRHRVALIGGNITRSPRSGAGHAQGPLMIDVTAIGSVKTRRVLTRSGARPGDEVFVTGTIGAAAAGLRSLQARHPGSGIGDPGSEEKYLRPEPRVRMGTLLGRNRAATACIDLSDGLADGLRQLAAASHVGITVDEASIPMAGGVAEFHSDDYELLFTVRPSSRGRLRAVKSQAGDLPITRIGIVTTDSRVIVRTGSGDKDVPAGYEHFR
jgi:thiamine-monophosphate kinase